MFKIMEKALLMSDLLSPRERSEYVSLMIVVRTGVQTFLEAGKALTIIREKKLYRERYDTFEHFCKDEFQMSRAYATRLINGFSTVSSLAVSGEELPSNERVVRELNKAPKDVKQNAWDLAKKISGNGHKPTSVTVKRAVLEFVTNGQRQRLDREIIGRLKTVNRLLGMDSDLAHSAPEVIREVMEQVAKAEALLRAIKSNQFRLNGHSRIDDH